MMEAVFCLNPTPCKVNQYCIRMMALSEADADVSRSFLYFRTFRESLNMLRISRAQFVSFNFLDSWLSLISAALCILQLGNGDRDNLDLAYADLPESVIVLGGKVILQICFVK